MTASLTGRRGSAIGEAREAASPSDITVTEPGVYDLPEAVYHGDCVPEGSLSCSGAKKLLPPSCPAIFRWERDHPPAPKKTFDEGHAAHRLVLGVGAELEVVPGERWDTNAAKAAVKAAREAGRVPLKESTFAQVQAMAARLRAHPVAGPLLADTYGAAESSLYWRDDVTGVMRRGRLDLLPNSSDDGRMVVPDYKSAVTANPAAFGKSAADYRYDMQAATYIEAVQALGLAEDVAFVFVVQQKTAPYLVSVVELDSLALRVGRHDNRKAVDLYARCRETDTWPGWDDEVALVSLPHWATATYEQESAA